ncbi:glycosyltransferase [Neobacillus dielmonensis]|uniref:glycosyltransferase n=1 Tax=Neobacillus dielmonensis TaxID=1347369 RepID=UPI0005A66DC2|nr:glycosyltransferase [Neobacillus dielmonensis]
MHQAANKSKSILFFIPWMVMGGADKFNLDLMRFLKSSGYKIFVCTTEPSGNEWQDRFETYTEAIYHFPNQLPFEKRPKFVLELMEKEQIDIVFISNSYFGYYILPWLKDNSPRKFVAVDYIHMEELYWWDGGFARFSSTVSDYLDKTYVTFGKLKQRLIDRYHIKPDKVEVAYICIDGEDEFNPQLIPFGQIRNQLQINHDTPVILFPCRLHVQKRPYLMLEIAKRLKQRGNHFVIWVVGDGHERYKMEKLVNEYGLTQQVQFLGSTRDVRPYYRDANMTLLCSILEAITFSSYESMAMETPVLSSDIGGQSELITPETGFILPTTMEETEIFNEQSYTSEEADCFVEVIETCIRQPEMLEEMGKNCRKRILNTFKQEEMFYNLVKEIEELQQKQYIGNIQSDLTDALYVLTHDYNHQKWNLDQKLEQVNQYKNTEFLSKAARRSAEKYLTLIRKELNRHKHIFDDTFHAHSVRSGEAKVSEQLLKTYIKMEITKRMDWKIGHYLKKLSQLN